MWVKLIDSEALGEGEVGTAQVDELSIALYRTDGVVYATSNICTHQYALMSDGYFDGQFIECPLHQALFDIKTGEAVEGPVSVPLTCFPAEERDGAIYVELS